MFELDSLHQGADVGHDQIDDFFTGRMWEDGVPGARVLIGRIQQESQPARGQQAVTKRTLYTVRTTQGHVIPDCVLLTPLSYGSFTKNRFAPDKQPGNYTKPYPGALCVVLTSNGGAAFIVGFFNPPTTIPAPGNDETTSETNPGSVEDVEARSPGDWIVRTEAAAINVKRMGAITVESGPSIRMTMNPRDGVHFTQSKTSVVIAEGYQARRGRPESSSPEGAASSPNAVATEDYFDKILQRGRTSIRIRVRNGQVDGSTRRELTLTSVNFATPSSPIETTLARERFFDDGSWIGEAPRYQWGGSGADEPLVLGNILVDLIKRLSNIIKQIKVTTAWGPSGPPLPPTPIDLAQLENDLDSMLSEYMFVTKGAPTLGAL